MIENFIKEDRDWATNRRYPDYEFSDMGDVWDVKKERGVKVTRPTKGSPVVGLRDRNGITHTCNLAKVILEAFRGERGENYRVHYRDGNKRNIELDNLMWEERPEREHRERHEWVPGRPDITLTDFYRNTYVKVLETGREYDNIWAYIDATGEKESVAKKCMRSPYSTTNSKGQHIIPYLYDDGNGDIEDLEGKYV